MTSSARTHANISAIFSWQFLSIGPGCRWIHVVTATGTPSLVQACLSYHREYPLEARSGGADSNGASTKIFSPARKSRDATKPASCVRLGTSAARNRVLPRPYVTVSTISQFSLPSMTFPHIVCSRAAWRPLHYFSNLIALTRSRTWVCFGFPKVEAAAGAAPGLGGPNPGAGGGHMGTGAAHGGGPLSRE